MKRKSALLVAGSLLLVAVSQKALSQEQKELPPVTVTTKSNVSKAVTKSFQSSFKNAVNTTWYKANRRYIADFIMNEQKNRALFQKNGAIIYHLTWGHEENLPTDVRRIVKSNYVDYNITNVINVEQNNRNIWVINLEDNKKLILVQVEDGALEEVGNYDKTM